MKRLPVILAAAVFAGCAHYRPEPIFPEKTAAQLESRRLSDPELKTVLEQNLGRSLTNWPQTNWDLRELTLAAFEYHPSLAVARQQWLVAAAGLRTAGARPNPSVGIQPGYDYQIPGAPSPWIVPLTFDLPIETAGKRGKRMALAEKVAEAARWDFVSTAWQIRAGVRSSLLDLNIGQRRVQLLREQFDLLRQILDLTDKRLAAGEIARAEVTAAQLALSRTQRDLSDARAAEADARARLAAAVGVTEAALDGLELRFDFSTDEARSLTSREARRVALQSRADIRAALADYAAAEADLKLQVAKQFPDLHLGPGYQWNQGSAGDNEWILGFNVELPILDQNQGPIGEAEARRKLTAAKFIELQSQILTAIDRATAALDVAREQLRIGDELLAGQKKMRESADAQWKAGLGVKLDLLAAQLEVSAATLAQLDNEAKLQAALGGLEDAVQRPVDSIMAVIEHFSK